jgi:hypothetical protein
MMEEQQEIFCCMLEELGYEAIASNVRANGFYER